MTVCRNWTGLSAVGRSLPDLGPKVKPRKSLQINGLGELTLVKVRSKVYLSLHIVAKYGTRYRF